MGKPIKYLIAVNGHALGELLLTRPIKVYQDPYNDALRIDITSGQTCLDICVARLEPDPEVEPCPSSCEHFESEGLVVRCLKTGESFPDFRACPEYVRCYACNGLGNYSSGERCVICEGNGSVTPGSPYYKRARLEAEAASLLDGAERELRAPSLGDIFEHPREGATGRHFTPESVAAGRFPDHNGPDGPVYSDGCEHCGRKAVHGHDPSCPNYLK